MSTTDELVYEVVGVCNHRGWLHGRDHISCDAGKSTLCGLRQRGEGGRSDIICLQNGWQTHVTWMGAYKCTRCEVKRVALGVPESAI
jgi:hypothetical protein